MYESLCALDNVRINFSATGSHILNILLSFIMFGVALDIRPNEFARLFRKPKALLGGLIAQMFFLPAVTFGIVLIFYRFLSPSVAMGMILVAACPGGNISNFICSWAKGKVELSVTMTALTTMLALLTTPFNFAFWGELYLKYFSRHSSSELLQTLSIDPVEMMQTVFILLGIPLILGIICNQFFRNFAARIAPWFQRFSLLLFLAMIVLAFSKNYDLFIHSIYLIFLVVLVHNAAAFGTGYLAGTILKVLPAERRAMSIEVGIQNSGLGLALLLNPRIFPVDAPIGGMLLVTAWWGIWHIVAGLTLGTFWHRRPVKQ